MYAGIDLGSTSTKAVLMDKGGIIAYHIVPSETDFSVSSERAFNEALKRSHASVKDIVATVTTGYGRYATNVPGKPVTEITCAARGAYFLCPGVKTILDIGGQDSKAIKIGNDGRVLRFALNDKCAAGTGRFLERTAASMGLNIDEFARISENSKIILKISNTCAVFAETEVISRLSQKEPIEGIVRGLHNALAVKIFGLAQKVKIEKDILICGGGARNAGLIRELRDLMGDIILAPDGVDSRLVPAIGAALIAKDG